MKRVVTTCSPEHECSLEEIDALSQESYDVDADASIKRYTLPSIAEMKTIVTEAENYSGEWYHSEVVVDEAVFVSEEHSALRDRIVELGANYGIYLLFSFHSESKGNALSVDVKRKLAEAFGLDAVV